MHISEISTSRSICINGDWDNTVIKVHLNEGDSYDQAKAMLETLSNEWEAKTRSKRSLSPEESIPVHQVGKVPSKLTIEEQLIADIGATTHLTGADGLESYKALINSNPAIKAAYDLKFWELKNKK